MIQLRNEQASVVIESSPQQADPSRTPHGRQISIGLICLGIFVLAFAVRIALLYTTRSYLEEEHSEVTNVASSLASGRGFASAYWNTGPTAHTSPLYPLLLSLVYRSFGTGVNRRNRTRGPQLLSSGADLGPPPVSSRSVSS
jgi:hypothetical protein